MTKDTSSGDLQTASASIGLGLKDERFRGGGGDKMKREVRKVSSPLLFSEGFVKCEGGMFAHTAEVLAA